jgi:hypothetical protein
VVSSVKYLSKKFQDHLCDQRGWTKKKSLSGQDIDAYIELPCASGYQLDKSRLTEFLDRDTTEKPEASIDDVFFRFVKRNCLGVRGTP